MPEWSGRYAREVCARVFAAYGWTCHLCGRPGATTADHLIPRSKGGSDALANLRPAHTSCNSARGDMDLPEWFRRHPIDRDRLPPSRSWYTEQAGI